MSGSGFFAFFWPFFSVFLDLPRCHCFARLPEGLLILALPLLLERTSLRKPAQPLPTLGKQPPPVARLQSLVALALLGLAFYA